MFFELKCRTSRSVAQVPLTIALVAFALRLATIVTNHTYQIPIRGRAWYFAYEMGAIAGSIAAGHGFRSPFCAACGPTAWVGPIYPLLLAGIFKVFGTYTNLSAFVSLAVNSLFGAVNALVIFQIARDIFDRRVALISSWAWAVLPYAIFWPTHWIWDTSLSALLLSTAFLLTLRLEGETDWRKWFGFGLFWAVIALTNAALLSFLPVSVGWLYWHLRQRPVGRTFAVAALVIAFALGISPWVVRNYLAFGSFVPLRSDLGEELYAGNHEGSNGLYYEVKRWNLSELQRAGEVRFVAERRRMALQFITTRPGDFAIFTAKRIGYFWCDLPWGWHVPHFGTGTRQALHFGFALTSFWGVWEAYKRKRKGTLLFLALFVVYPLVYYITHVQPRFQHPITPEMLVVSVYLFSVSAGQAPTLPSAWRKMTSLRYKARHEGS
ncbi:MAG TPA: glycosyltransferase family 39 protein [Terriglobales bacterium]|nr:glycosyltransferase family 39 protein [Terriglobales bacterium]